MAFCSVCGKTAPCGVQHKKGKPTARSRAFALGRAGPSRGNNNAGRDAQVPVTNTEEWRIHGPNQAVKHFPGVVKLSENVTVKSVDKGRYYAFRLRDHLNDLFGNNLTIYGVIFRFCCDHSNGAMGLVRGWDVHAPTPPNPLSRKKFTKGMSMGIQLIAPNGAIIDELPTDLWVVFRFDNEFEAETALWTRDSYVQHSAVPKIKIPPDVLSTERIPPSEDIRG